MYGDNVPCGPVTPCPGPGVGGNTQEGSSRLNGEAGSNVEVDQIAAAVSLHDIIRRSNGLWEWGSGADVDGPKLPGHHQGNKSSWSRADFNIVLKQPAYSHISSL